MKVRKKVALVLASIARKTAQKTVYSVSKEGYYQPKAPKGLIERLEKK